MRLSFSFAFQGLTLFTQDCLIPNNNQIVSSFNDFFANSIPKSYIPPKSEKAKVSSFKTFGTFRGHISRNCQQSEGTYLHDVQISREEGCVQHLVAYATILDFNIIHL